MGAEEVRAYRSERKRFMAAWQRRGDRNTYNRLLSRWSKVKDAWDSLAPDEQKREPDLPREPM